MAWLDDFLLENAPGDREMQKRLERARILRKGPGAAPEIPIPEVDTLPTGGYFEMMRGENPGAPPTPGQIPSPQQAPAQAPGGPRVLKQALGGTQTSTGGQNAPVAPAGAPGGAATGQPTPATPGAVDPLQARIDAERTRLDAALAEQDKLLAPPDRTAAEEAYRKRAASGGKHMALALLANEAKLEPFSAQHLKQAAEARAPMKMAGGTMTDEGFIEDPAYQQEMKLRRADGRLKQIQQAMDAAVSAQERERLKKMELAARKELQDAQIASQQLIAGMTHSYHMASLAQQRDAAAAKAGKGGKGAGVPSQAETEDVLKQIEGLLPHSTGSYLGYGADQAARAFGVATEGAKAGGAIAPLSARILMAVPRFEGPQGEKDVKIYQEAAGNLADTTIPIEQRQAAIQTIRYLNQKYPGGAAPPAGGGGGVINYSDLK